MKVLILDIGNTHTKCYVFEVTSAIPDQKKGGPMNRTLERTTMIVIALLLSIGFTGQHPSHAQAKLWVKVVVGDDDKLTALETLTKSYVERELRDLSYVNVVDRLETFTVGIIMPENEASDLIIMSYVLTKWHKDCSCLVQNWLLTGDRRELRELCQILAASLDHELKKFKP